MKRLGSIRLRSAKPATRSSSQAFDDLLAAYKDGARRFAFAHGHIQVHDPSPSHDGYLARVYMDGGKDYLIRFNHYVDMFIPLSQIAVAPNRPVAERVLALWSGR